MNFGPDACRSITRLGAHHRSVYWLLGLVALAAVALWHYGKRPVVYRGVGLSEFSRFIKSMVVQMSPGSFVIATREDGEGFIQFALVRAHPQWSEIELGLPDVRWSSAGFDRISDALVEAGFSPSTESPSESVRLTRVRAAGTPEVVAEAGVRMATVVCTQLEWPSPRFTVRFDGGIRAKALRGA